jgi:hypothetical protein
MWFTIESDIALFDHLSWPSYFAYKTKQFSDAKDENKNS